MNISHYEKQELLKSFPDIKLSYVKKLHKKVTRTANLYWVIPKGRKFFVWFRYYKNKANCYILEIDTFKNQIKKIFRKFCCFDETLCIGRGTICYGTCFTNNMQNFFTIEDIYYFKGISLKNNTLINKLNSLEELVTNYLKVAKIHKNDIIIALPIITDTRSKLNKLIENVTYPIYAIQLRYFKNNEYLLNEIYLNQVYTKIFLVKPQPINDIYSLYLFDKNKKINVFHESAIIPDYKTSVFMNKLFRNIKENDNLDLLEESDDEEDFQDVNVLKYIKKKELTMECVYLKNYKKWKPLKVLEGQTISFLNEVITVEKNNRY